MHFDLVDAVLAADDSAITTVKLVSRSEEYLQDHFPAFPVLPGVFMIESLAQAARALLERRGVAEPMVLGGARAVKYGTFVKPGWVLRADVRLLKVNDDGSYDFKGEGRTSPAFAADGGADDSDGGQVAVSGRFTLRPLRLGVG